MNGKNLPEATSRLNIFLDRARTVALVFDDAPLESVLAGESITNGDTPVDAIERWRLGLDRSVDAARAVAALLVRRPERAVEIGAASELEEHWQRTVATPGALPVRSTAACFCGLATLAEARGSTVEAIVWNTRAIDLYATQRGTGMAEFVAVTKRTLGLLERVESTPENRRLERTLRMRHLLGKRDSTSRRELRQIAVDLFLDNDFDTAERLLRALIENRFELAETRFHHARLLTRLDRLEAAEAELEFSFAERVLVSNNLRAQLHFLRALIGLLTRRDVAQDLRELGELLRIPEVRLDQADEFVLAHALPRIAPSYRTLMTTLARAFRSRLHMLDLEQHSEWATIAEQAAKTRAIALLPQKDALLTGSETTAGLALSCSELGIELRRGGLTSEAEELFRRAIAIEDQLLPTDHPRRPHRRNHLAAVLLLQGRWNEAREVLSTAWSLAHTTADLTAARILCLRLGLAWIVDESPNIFLGQLKTLLSGKQLRASGNIASLWCPTDVLNALCVKLSQEQGEALVALAAALNCTGDLAHLNDRISFWRELAPVSLDQPWQGDSTQ